MENIFHFKMFHKERDFTFFFAIENLVFAIGLSRNSGIFSAEESFSNQFVLNQESRAELLIQFQVCFLCPLCAVQKASWDECQWSVRLCTLPTDFAMGEV